MNTPHKRKQGNQAEALALTWLEYHGYALIESNFNRRVGEIDLIVRHPDNRTVVFVEVRYRSGQQFGSALESVNYHKQQRLKHTANAWFSSELTALPPLASMS